MATYAQGTGSVVIGYFATGHAAHRAINALIDEGFVASEIGAAFHVGGGTEAGASEQGSQANVGGSLREELGTTLPGRNIHASNTAGGAASDSSQVQYAALGGGAGTPFDGPSRPGPITGSSLVNTGLPSELKSELPHDAPLPHGGVSSQHAYTPSSSTPNAAAPVHESWIEKLTHVFSGKKATQTTSPGVSTTATPRTETVPLAPVTAESQAFGTGEGHLHLGTAGGASRRYSQPAFESSFSGYGLPGEHARSLSQRIGHGGAIVTVHASSRAIEAERVLEAHGGEVRFAATSGEADYGTAENDSNVEVFGTVDRDYAGYLD